MAVKPVQVKGLTELRRDLRRVDKESVKEIRKTIKAAAEIVAREAGTAAEAHSRSGALAGAFRSTTSGTRGIVRNRLVYARFIEFGFHPRGSGTYVPGREYIGRALERRQDAVIEKLGDGIDRAAKASGWR